MGAYTWVESISYTKSSSSVLSHFVQSFTKPFNFPWACNRNLLLQHYYLFGDGIWAMQTLHMRLVPPAMFLIYAETNTNQAMVGGGFLATQWTHSSILAISICWSKFSNHNILCCLHFQKVQATRLLLLLLLMLLLLLLKNRWHLHQLPRKLNILLPGTPPSGYMSPNT